MSKSKPRVIVILGIAGSGKSTQAEMLAKTAGYRWLSVGELLRSKVDKKHQEDLLSGKLLDEQYVTELVASDIYKPSDYSGVVLDGFPRSLGQAEWLFNQVRQNKIELEAVVHLYLSEYQAKKRLLSRGRLDDHDQAIKERFEEYEEVIKPILKTLADDNVFIVQLKAEGSIEKIQASIVEKLLSNGLATV